MNTRPEIDMDKYHNIMGTEQIEQVEENEPPARFCSRECREEYRNDRMSGIPLSTTTINGQAVSHKQMCAKMELCAYCLSKLT